MSASFLGELNFVPCHIHFVNLNDPKIWGNVHGIGEWQSKNDISTYKQPYRVMNE